MQKILIVEDDAAIRDVISDILRQNNYSIETAIDGTSALDLLKKVPPDLLLLDLGLPDISGESICIQARKLYSTLPIIILTAKNQTLDVVNGLNLGADDYISKPFELEVMLARIKARLRTIEKDSITIANLMLDAKSYEVKRDGKIIPLTPHEFTLLQYLMVNTGTVLSREMILNRVWQYSFDVDSRVVDVYIGYLRKKIDNGHDQKLIQSIRGFGYTIKE